MASNGKISIGFKIEAGKDGLQTLILDSQGLKKALEATVEESEKLHKKFINFAAVATGIDSVSNTLTSIQGKMKEYTSAYAAQAQVENQLAQVMRNTMGAREEDIQSIKDFCSAQQEIGIVGDEVQLAGAQELATYLELKSSLKGLIPVMNDMLAQQYGFNATQENASQIATMLGKVMEGQTGALSRYGYKFDEAQEKILKYGTESEKVATLVDVVSSSVGGMNEKLAQTPTGKMKQLENSLGDVKEQIGELALMAEPFVTLSASALLAFGSIIKLGSGLKVTYKWMASLKLVTTATGAAMRALGLSSKFAAASIKGLLISTGVGAAIWALTEIVQGFASSTDDAADATNRLVSAEERAKRAAEMAEDVTEAESDARRSAVSSLEMYIAKLKEFHGSKTEERKLVEELNNTYGSTMGYFSSVADWYQALISNSEAYCRQMVAEARTRKLANQIAELEDKNYKITHKEDGSLKKYSTSKVVGYNPRKVSEDEVESYRGLNGNWGMRLKSTGQAVRRDSYGNLYTTDKITERDVAQQEYDNNRKQIETLQTRMREGMEKVEMPVRGTDKPETGNGSAGSGGSSEKRETVFTENATTLRELDDNIKILTDRLQTATIEEAPEINRRIAEERVKAEAIRSAGIEKQTEPSGPVFREDASNLKEYEENIQTLRQELETATEERAAEINKETAMWEERVSKIRNAGLEKGEETDTYRVDASNLSEYEENVKVLQERLQTASVDEAALLNRDIRLWQEKADAIRNAGEETESAFDAIRQGWDVMTGLEGCVESLTDALSGNVSAWEAIVSIVDSFIRIYDGISQVIGILETLQLVTRGSAEAKREEAAAAVAATTAEGVAAAESEATAAAQIPVIAANKVAASSFMEVAAASYFAAHAYIPFAGFGIATGFVTAAESVVKTIGVVPFADGGVIYGPTLGLVGEYAGAKSNPEVIAPLDRLQEILGPTDGNVVIVGGELTARGRDIVAVLANETRISGKSGKRTNIRN